MYHGPHELQGVHPDQPRGRGPGSPLAMPAQGARSSTILVMIREELWKLPNCLLYLRSATLQPADASHHFNKDYSSCIIRNYAHFPLGRCFWYLTLHPFVRYLPTRITWMEGDYQLPCYSRDRSLASCGQHDQRQRPGRSGGPTWRHRPKTDIHKPRSDL